MRKAKGTDQRHSNRVTGQHYIQSAIPLLSKSKTSSLKQYSCFVLSLVHTPEAIFFLATLLIHVLCRQHMDEI